MAYYSHLDIKEAFALFDRNGDGKISCSEVGMVLKKMGYNFTTKELGKMLERVDKDGNGYIDFQEFTDMLIGKPISAESETELIKVFKMLDIKGKGHIGVKELQRVTQSVGQKLSKKEIRKMISIADSDGDGKVSFDEFKQIMKKQDKVDNS